PAAAESLHRPVPHATPCRVAPANGPSVHWAAADALGRGPIAGVTDLRKLGAGLLPIPGYRTTLPSRPLRLASAATPRIRDQTVLFPCGPRLGDESVSE